MRLPTFLVLTGVVFFHAEYFEFYGFPLGVTLRRVKNEDTLLKKIASYL